jgi:hypothetical protein
LTLSLGMSKGRWSGGPDGRLVHGIFCEGGGIFCEGV